MKNTLTRRAAEAAGAEALLALLEGPTAIAFVETDGDPSRSRRRSPTRRRTRRSSRCAAASSPGSSITGDEVEALAKLPPPEVVKSQLVGVIVAPLTQLAGLLAAPLRDLVGLIDARIAQLEEGGDTSALRGPRQPSPRRPTGAEAGRSRRRGVCGGGAGRRRAGTA